MINDFILYVDFDRTLYDTKRFGADLFALISTEAGVSYDEARSTSRQFVSDPRLGGYDYEAHIASYGLSPTVMWQKLDEMTSSNNYLYPDSAPFIQSARQRGYDPKILSFGEEQFQMAKITPTIEALIGNDARQLEVTVLDIKKHQHIRKLHPGQTGALIDDISDQELPEGFTEIHIDRNTNIPNLVKTKAGFVICNLEQALAALDLLTQHKS